MQVSPKFWSCLARPRFAHDGHIGMALASNTSLLSQWHHDLLAMNITTAVLQKAQGFHGLHTGTYRDRSTISSS